jgi:hypothetical protein
MSTHTNVSASSRTARVETTHEEAALVAAALAPDDTDSITTKIDATRIVTDIERETTGGLQATVDDYVVNLTVAETVIDTVRDTT